MAKKRTAAMPTAKMVEAELAKGRLLPAYNAARDLYNLSKTAEHERLFHKVIAAVAESHFTNGEFHLVPGVLEHAEEYAEFDAKEWPHRLAILWSRAGFLREALDVLKEFHELESPTVGKALGHAADGAMVKNDPKSLPDDHRPAFATLRAAFDHYAAGNDEPARESLAAIGLQSPFLEWKVLLRGLIAFNAKEDDRAVENFARLNPERIPFRIAAPIRAKIDPAYAALQPAEVLGQYRHLQPSGMLAELRKIQAAFAREKYLDSAFKILGGVLPMVKSKAPALVPKLANCFYYTLLRQGQPDDMGRYKAQFGSPPDDPNFHKLQATILEQMDDWEAAVGHWIQYEHWLQTTRPGWPEPLAKRCRAMILHRIGKLVEDILNDDGIDEPDSFYDEILGMMGGKKLGPKPKPKKKYDSPEHFYQKALELAPGWETPTLELMTSLVSLAKFEEAEAVAKKYLELDPQNEKMLQKLGALYHFNRRFEDAYAARERLLAVNPLDFSNRCTIGISTLALARQRAVDGNLVETKRLLASRTELLADLYPTHTNSLLAIVHLKEKDATQAKEFGEIALAGSGARLAALLLLYVNATLLKLKPATRKVYQTAYEQSLKEPHSLAELRSLLQNANTIIDEGWKFTGSATLDKKIHDAIVKSTRRDGEEVEYEKMTEILFHDGSFAPLKKYLTKLLNLFPRNALFALRLVECEFEIKEPSDAAQRKLLRPLQNARYFIENGMDDRHRDLLPKIEEWIHRIYPMERMFDRMFNRR